MAILTLSYNLYVTLKLYNNNKNHSGECGTVVVIVIVRKCVFAGSNRSTPLIALCSAVLRDPPALPHQ